MRTDDFAARELARQAWEALPEIERLGGDADRHFPVALLEAELREIELDMREAARPKPLRATCSTQYRAIRSSGSRRLSGVSLLVVHSTESLSARGAARWFTDPACRGSAHVVVDAFECFQTLPPSVIPWAAPGANGRGWHLEVAGRAGWTRREWLSRRGTIERAAFKLAFHARAFGIPIVRLSNRDLRAGAKRGVVDHDQCSEVFGGTHWDVGEGFPFDVLLTRARAYRKGL
jgi:hypothetical protein